MASHAAHGAHGDHAEHPNYVKIWFYLLVLLVISFVGPFFGHRYITLITAFGIAVVKAYMVAKNFMHVNVQPRYVGYFLGTALVFMLLFYAGAAPDVMKKHGDNWTKTYVDPAPSAHPAHH